jgi:hypothetical protein
LIIFVLDTSALTDPRLRDVFGVNSLDGVVIKLAELMEKVRLSFGMEFHIAPSVYDELRKYLLSNGVSEETFSRLEAILAIKAPDKIRIQIPAIVMSNYIKEINTRLYKGLRVAEESIKRTAKEAKKTVMGDSTSYIIHELRQKFREATRKGIIDSVIDFDTVLLAKELKATLVTNDEGIKRLGHDLGLIVADPIMFIRTLKRFNELSRNS